jgi:hypothetical protein
MKQLALSAQPGPLMVGLGKNVFEVSKKSTFNLDPHRLQTVP